MYGKVKVGNKELELVANAATAYRFKQVFHQDLLKFFTLASKGEEGESDYMEYLQKLAYIMKLQADKNDFQKIGEESYIKWLEDFDQFDFVEPLTDIVNIYQGNTKVDVSEKNGDTQQKES